MNIAYNKSTKTITISDFGSLDNPVLYINDVLTQNLDTDNTYVFSSDGVYKITVIDDSSTTELGYVLVIEYSKDRNRELLVSVLDNTSFYEIPIPYVKNNKIIREIEFSFYSGNIKRIETLLKEIKWN